MDKLRRFSAGFNNNYLNHNSSNPSPQDTKPLVEEKPATCAHLDHQGELVRFPISPTWDPLSICALMNLGAVDTTGIKKNPDHQIAFLKDALKLAHLNDPNALGDITSLLQQLDQFILLQGHESKGLLLEKLEKQGYLDLYSGYADHPTGHAVWVRLVRTESGQITGKLVQTGEGVHYHGKTATNAHREQSAPELLLQPITFEELKSSRFLENLITVRKTVFSNDNPFNIHLFYGTCVASWPGKIQRGDSPSHGLQRGGTCSVKVFLRFLEDQFPVHLYPKVKLYLRIYSIWSLLDSNVTLQSVGLGRIKTALDKCRQTLVKQQLSPQDPAYLLFIALEDKWLRLEKDLQEDLCQHAHLLKKTLAPSIFPKLPSQPLAYLPKEQVIEYFGETHYALFDFSTILLRLRTLSKQDAGRYALHVLSHLPLAENWPTFSFPDFVNLCRDLKELIKPILRAAQPKSKKIPFALTPRHYAAFINLAGGLVKTAQQIQSPHYARWLETFFPRPNALSPLSTPHLRALFESGSSYLKKGTSFVISSFRNAFAFDREACSSESVQSHPLLLALQEYSGLSWQAVLEKQTCKRSIFALPLDLHLLLILSTHYAHPFPKVAPSLSHKYSVTSGSSSPQMHWMHLEGLSSLSPFHPSLQSYYPWNAEDVNFINSLFLPAPRSSNEALVILQEGDDFAGHVLEWDELLLLRSILHAPEPKILQLFEYLTTYPHRQRQEPFQALALMLAAVTVKSTTLLPSTWAQEFFESELTCALQSSHLPQTAFLLRLFAQIQGFHSDCEHDLKRALQRVQKHTGWSTAQRESLALELIALAPYLPSTFYPLLKGELQRAPALQHNAMTATHLQEDLAMGRILLWQAAFLALDKKSPSLPSHILAHESFPFLQRFPRVLEKKHEGDSTLYAFLDDDGAPCSVLQTDSGDLFFVKEFDGQRYLLQDLPSSLTNPSWLSYPKEHYGSAILFDPQEADYWLSEKKDGAALIVTKGRGHGILARCLANKICHPANPDWFLASTQHLPTPLLQMDEAGYLVPWVDEDNLIVCIEYPRLRFALFWNAKQGCYQESKAPYRKVVDQTLPELGPTTPYLVLQRPSGAQEAMVAEFTFNPNKVCLSEKSQPKPHYGEDNSKFLYPLSAQGTLLAGEDKRANLFLIALLLQQGHYEKANDLVSALVRHPFLWSSKERHMLSPGIRFFPPIDWQDDEDHHGALSAIRLRLLFSAYPLDHELSAAHRHYIIRDYSNYLDQLNSVGSGFLSPQEEKRALNLWQTQKGKVSQPAALRAQALGLESIEARSPTYPTIMQVRQCLPLPHQADFLSVDPKSFSILSGDALLSYYTVLRHHASQGSRAERKTLREATERLIFDANSNVRYHAASIHMIAERLGDPSNSNAVWDHLLFLQTRSLRKLPWQTLYQGATHSKRLPSPSLPQEVLLEEHISFPAVELVSCILQLLQEPYSPQDPEAIDAQLSTLREVYDVSTSEPCLERLLEKKRSGIQHFATSLQNHEEKLLTQSKPYYNPRLLESQKKAVEKALREAIVNLDAKVTHLYEALEEQLQRLYREDALRYQLPARLTCQEVAVLFARGELLKILACYPSLEPKLPLIRQQIADYLVYATELQLLQRAYQDLSSIKKSLSPAAKTLAEDKFVATLSAKRRYHQEDARAFAYLVFEYVSNRRLFGRQLALLTSLLETSEQYNAIAETGFGKSSTLLPLWLFLTSVQRGKITALTVPSSLLEDTVTNLKEVLGPLGSRVHRLDFDRDKLQDYRLVENLCSVLQSSEGTLFVMSMNTAQLLNDLALTEALLENKPTILARHLQRLRLLWKDEVHNFVDESDELLGSDEHVYATGQRQSLSWPHRARATQFYTEILLHPKIVGKWRFSFLSTEDAEKKEVTTESYGELKEDLIALLLEKEHQSPSNKESSKTKASYLRGGFHSACDKSDTLRYWKNQLNSLLPSTLVAKYGSRYQVFLDDGRFLAVPCMAGVVRPSYEFANLNELINFTVQANLAHPLPPSFVHQMMTLFPSELKAGTASLEDKKTLETILSNAQLAQVKNKKDLKQLTLHLNRHLTDKALFISIAILRKITTYSHKIASTSHTFVLSHKTHGTSATVRADSLPPIMKTQGRPKVGIGNLLALVTKGAQVHTLAAPTPLALLQESLQKGTFYGLVDQAGLFSELPITQIQQVVFETLPYCHVLYFYDTQGQPMLWRKGKERPSPLTRTPLLKKTFIYLAESKAVGTDAPMLPDAKLLVTVDWRTSHSRLEQAIGRARNLQKGQSIDFATTQKSWELICDTLQREKMATSLPSSNLLRYALWQERASVSNEYHLALQRYPVALLRQQIWQAPKNLWDPLFKALEPFFKLPIEGENPTLPTGKKLAAKEVVDQIRHQFFDTLKKTLDHLPDHLSEVLSLHEIREKFEEYAKSYSDHLTAYVDTHEAQGRGQLVAAQVQTQTETAAARSQHKAQYFAFSPNLDHSITSHSHLFGIDIAISSSMANVSIDSPQANEKIKKSAYYYLLKIRHHKPKIYCIDFSERHIVEKYINAGCYLLKDDKILASPPQKGRLAHLSDLVKEPQMLQRILLLSHLLKRNQRLSPQEKNLLSKQELTKLTAWAHNVLNLDLLSD